jgi:hypothetical protein
MAKIKKLKWNKACIDNTWCFEIGCREGEKYILDRVDVRDACIILTLEKNRGRLYRVNLCDIEGEFEFDAKFYAVTVTKAKRKAIIWMKQRINQVMAELSSYMRMLKQITKGDFYG